jgi:uncharacterized membrane protein
MNDNVIKNNRIAPITKLLMVSSALCILILSIRIHVSSSIYYTFFVWNLFLAWIPFLLSNALLNMQKRQRSALSIGMMFFVWLLFFPNAPYIITDLFHLKKIQNIPLWFDLVLIVSFAWNGLMIGYVSLLKVQHFLTKQFNLRISWVVILTVLCLSAFGIYLGRFERWNSWDILTHPFALMGNIFHKFSNPLSYPRTIGVTLFFSVFLITSYSTLFYLIDSKNHEQ